METPMNAARPLGFLICAFVSGCITSPELMSPAELVSTRAAVIEATHDFERLERERDVEGVLACLAPGFYMYQDGHRVDLATTVAQIKGTLPTLRAFEPRFEDVEVIILGRDAALVSMLFHDVITDANGTTTRLWGPTTLLWRRHNETWRIAYADSDHYPDE